VPLEAFGCKRSSSLKRGGCRRIVPALSEGSAALLLFVTARPFRGIGTLAVPIAAIGGEFGSDDLGDGVGDGFGFGFEMDEASGTGGSTGELEPAI